MMRLDRIAVLCALAFTLTACGGTDTTTEKKAGPVSPPPKEKPKEQPPKDPPTFKNAQWGPLVPFAEIPNPRGRRRVGRIVLAGTVRAGRVEYVTVAGFKRKDPTVSLYSHGAGGVGIAHNDLLKVRASAAVAAPKGFRLVYHVGGDASTSVGADLMTCGVERFAKKDDVKLMPTNDFPAAGDRQRVETTRMFRLPSGRLAITAGYEPRAKGVSNEFILYLQDPKTGMWPGSPSRGIGNFRGNDPLPLLVYESGKEVRVVTATRRGGIIHKKTSDNGATWQNAGAFPKPKGFSRPGPLAVAQSGKYVYIAMGAMSKNNKRGKKRLVYILYASADGGMTWAFKGPITPAVIPQDPALHVRLAARGERVAFVFTETLGRWTRGEIDARLYVSDDAGSKWSLMDFNEPPFVEGRNSFYPVIFFDPTGENLHIAWGEFIGKKSQRLVARTLHLARP